jgi:RNA polymerase sigma factor (sigma-70 family)
MNLSMLFRNILSYRGALLPPVGSRVASGEGEQTIMRAPGLVNGSKTSTARGPICQSNETSDAILIQRVGAGDQAALEQLYKRYYPYLFRFIFRTTRRLEVIEDIINDVMFVIWQKAATLELRSCASTWILGIAYHKSLKALYGNRESYKTLSLEDVERDLPHDSKATMEHVELADMLMVALASLSPEHRAVVELAYYHGMHYSEIAKVIGCPEATVKTRMFYARKKLRSRLPDLFEGANAGAPGGLP